MGNAQKGPRSKTPNGGPASEAQAVPKPRSGSVNDAAGSPQVGVMGGILCTAKKTPKKPPKSDTTVTKPATDGNMSPRIKNLLAERDFMLLSYQVPTKSPHKPPRRSAKDSDSKGAESTSKKERLTHSQPILPPVPEVAEKESFVGRTLGANFSFGREASGHIPFESLRDLGASTTPVQDSVLPVSVPGAPGTDPALTHSTPVPLSPPSAPSESPKIPRPECSPPKQMFSAFPAHLIQAAPRMSAKRNLSTNALRDKSGPASLPGLSRSGRALDLARRTTSDSQYTSAPTLNESSVDFPINKIQKAASTLESNLPRVSVSQDRLAQTEVGGRMKSVPQPADLRVISSNPFFVSLKEIE